MNTISKKNLKIFFTFRQKEEMPSRDTDVTISLTSDAGDSQKLLRPKDGNYSNFQSSNRDSLISNASTTSRASTISEKWEFLLILLAFLF